MREHRLIERMIAILKRELTSIDERGATDPELIDTVVDFLTTYADRCHHGKEEDILFRELAAKDMEPALAAEMAGLIEDHVRSRALVRGLAGANRRYAGGDSAALREIRTALESLVELYPAHIAKEDRHFFKPALEYFIEAERARMLREYADFDRALIHAVYTEEVEGAETSVRPREQ